MESTAAPSIPNYGGQAVIEGVMIRSRRAMAVAVRHPAGHTVVHVEPLRSARQRSRWARLPLIRGMVLLWDTLVLGMRALAFSANVAAAEDRNDGAPVPTAPDDPAPEEPDARPEESAAMPQGVLWGAMAFAFTMGIGLFFVLPLLLVRTVDPLIPWSVASNLIEGLVRLALLLGYIGLIGLLADVRRVFAYHGAEHKAINAFEASVPLEREQVSRHGTVHPRCGTSFLLVVVVLSIAIFSLLGRPALPVRLASRVLLVPVIAGVSYEFLRFAATRRHRAAIRALMAPGLLLQRLTTREPDASQVEVAIEALRRLLTYEAYHPAAASPAPG